MEKVETEGKQFTCLEFIDAAIREIFTYKRTDPVMQQPLVYIEQSNLVRDLVELQKQLQTLKPHEHYTHANLYLHALSAKYSRTIYSTYVYTLLIVTDDFVD